MAEKAPVLLPTFKRVFGRDYDDKNPDDQKLIQYMVYLIKSLGLDLGNFHFLFLDDDNFGKGDDNKNLSQLESCIKPEQRLRKAKHQFTNKHMQVFKYTEDECLNPIPQTNEKQ